MAPDPSDTDQSGSEAPLLPTSNAPAPHSSAGQLRRAADDDDEVWSTWSLKRVPTTAQVNWYLQLAIFLIACVGVWAAWPNARRFGVNAVEERVVSLPLCGAVVDPEWPTDIGFAGPTSTGTEAQAAQTAYPSYNDISPIKPPPSLWQEPVQLDSSGVAPSQTEEEPFNIFHKLGNLSPWRTVSHGLAADAQIPDGCEVEQVQLLHRHGARYPTSNSGPATFAKKLAGAKQLRATGSLSFLNNYHHKLGTDILTPFGRDQLFSLGASFRVKYGHLLSKHLPSKPVFRTESQDRMHKSSLNFAAGFFGIPYEEQYNQLITVEWANFNNTLAPKTCKNSQEHKTEGHEKRAQWRNIYLKDAVTRLQRDLSGLTLSTEDALDMQALCAYEMVALGGSAFCELFTEEEWEGFDHYSNIDFWYRYSFGHPVQAANGLGWVQEWLARTTNTPLSHFNSTTNSTLHTDEYFPLSANQSLFVDATHDTVLSAVVTTLDFASLAASGPPPSTHLPAPGSPPSFVTSHIAPFGANLHSQVVSCPSSAGQRKRWVRWVLNDGVVPLTHEKACNSGVWLEKLGFCELDPYVAMLIKKIGKIDWAHDCYGKWEPSKPVTNGRPSRD